MRRDLKKELRDLYSPSAHVVQRVDVPTLRFLKIDGQGDPNESPEYGEAVEALFSLSYALKFRAKKTPLEINYVVMPSKACGGPTICPRSRRARGRSGSWTMMIMQPDFIDGDLIEETRRRGGREEESAWTARIRLESLTEGSCAQILHVGPFSTEGPTIEKVHRFITESGHEPSGKHHEIYLSDIRKADPNRWKTVIRQPFR